MATTPRRPRYQDAAPETPSTDKRRLKGLWHGGEWWCNCSPRKKAVERNVQKNTPNKGKWFWACPVPPPESCGFFLWTEDARLREMGLQSSVSVSEDAVAGREEPTPRSKTPSLAQQRLTSCGFQLMGNRRRSDDEPRAVASNFAPLTPGPSGASKRKRDAFEDDEFDDMGSDEERQLAAMADRSVERMARQRGYKETTANPSPSQPIARTLFPRSASSKRQRTVSFEEPQPSPTPTKTLTSKSCTQSTSSLPSSSPGAPSTSSDSSDITEQVMHLLQGQRIEDSVLNSVRQLLLTSARRTKGIAMGRDSTRAAVSERDAKIARLQERIVALEEKERLLNSRATDMKAGLMKLYENN